MNENAMYVAILADILKDWNAKCNLWHTHQKSISEHVDDDNEHYVRLQVLMENMIKDGADKSESVVPSADQIEIVNPGR